MAGLDAFADITKRNEPLAPYTYFKLGGPAEALNQPRTREQLAAVVKHCQAERVPLHILGGGGNVLIRDEGLRGVVLRLNEAPFTGIEVSDRQVRAGCGASLAAVISEATRHGLAGLETLVGIPGSVGGALRRNAGDRANEIGQHVRLVEVMDERGHIDVRERAELSFAPGASNLDDPVLLSVGFELERDDPNTIVKRMRKAWIQRKASQPLSFQAAGRIFKDPRGRSATGLIEQANLAKTRVGGAEVSDRNTNFIIAHPGATARDVLRLIELVRSRVQEKFAVELELEIAVW